MGESDRRFVTIAAAVAAILALVFLVRDPFQPEQSQRQGGGTIRPLDAQGNPIDLATLDRQLAQAAEQTKAPEMPAAMPATPAQLPKIAEVPTPPPTPVSPVRKGAPVRKVERMADNGSSAAPDAPPDAAPPKSQTKTPTKAQAATRVTVAAPAPVKETPVKESPAKGATKGAGQETSPTTQSYVVKAGDSLWSITQTHYGDPSLAKALAAFNGNPGPLRVGMSLRLPPAAQLGGSATTVMPAAAQRVHLLKRGESLSLIARHYYGDGNQWRRIAAANPGLDPNRLRVGERIVVPE